MVIMMLDHTRDFVHSAALQFDPVDLSRTNVALFLTRWITHFCAPVFVFLAGTGAYLQLLRGKTKGELSRFLLTRGLWLVVLEFTLIKTVTFFSFDVRFLGVMQVIWVIGVSMIVLAALIHLPLKLVAVFGLGMIALHNLLDGFRVESWRGPESAVPGVGAKLWMILHQPFEAFPIVGFPSPIVFVVYPLIPWVGVMAVGYVFGSLYGESSTKRRKWLLLIGGLSALLFFVVRAINFYGDPSQWSTQKDVIFTVLSFLNTTKYPPSLLFLLMTLGPAIAALAWFEARGANEPKSNSSFAGFRRSLIIFGRVPLFFYILQWPTAHTISILLHWAFGKPVAWLLQTPLDWFTSPPQGVGFNLGVVYLSWIGGVVLLYPLCKWFAGVKQRGRRWWLSYL